MFGSGCRTWHSSVMKTLCGSGKEYVPMFEALIVGIVSALFIAALSASFRHRHYIRPAVRCTLFCRNSKLRVSIAAILKLCSNNRYVLIRNHHRPEVFGPIGGVYEYYPSASDQLDQCGFIPQVRDQDMKNDLRGFLKAKYLPSFMRWFLSGKNREVEHLTSIPCRTNLTC